MRKTLLVAVMALVVIVPAVPVSAGSAEPGGRIVFTDAVGGSGLYAIAADGTDRVLLVPSADEYLGFPRWSPDRSSIAFVAQRRYPRRSIYSVDDNGDNRTKLVGPGEIPDGWSIGSFDWSSDGTRFVLDVSNDETRRTRLYVTPIDGSSLERIARNAVDPDWSSDDRIVAVRFGRLVVMDADGQNQTVIVERGSNRSPRWSPDAARIVFERRIRTPGYPPRADVFVVNADGTGLENLTRSPEIWDWSPSWSPTGRHIVWSPSPPGDSFGYADLWRMRANGRGQTPITTTKRLDEYQPDWADAPI